MRLPVANLGPACHFLNRGDCALRMLITRSTTPFSPAIDSIGFSCMPLALRRSDLFCSFVALSLFVNLFGQIAILLVDRLPHSSILSGEHFLEQSDVGSIRNDAGVTRSLERFDLLQVSTGDDDRRY
jgi:hypothetical protein